MGQFRLSYISQPSIERAETVEKAVFLEKLKKLVDLAKSKQNALDAGEINDFFAADNLGPEIGRAHV